MLGGGGDFSGSPSRGAGVGSKAVALVEGVVSIDTGEEIVGAAATEGAGGVGIDCVCSGRLDVATESSVSETGVWSGMIGSMG